MTFAALDSALTGPLFATDAMRAVFSDRARLAAMLRVEAALARSQGRMELAAAIETVSADDLDLEAIGRDTALAGVPTIPFVRAVQARLPAGLTGFHQGATTQDVLDTALVLQMRDAFDLIAADALAIVDGLARLADAHRNVPCAGRTYGQHAAPITFGFKAATWLAGFTDVLETLPQLRQRALVASLGGPVGTLAAMGANAPALLDAFAADLGLAAPAIAWHTRRSRIVEVGAGLSLLIGAAAKMATDVAHLASTEVGEIVEPHLPGRGGSTAMPHKRNPVSSTVILAAHAAARGHLVVLNDAMAAAHERPAGLWHAEWHALPPLFGLASGVLREGRALAEGLMIDARRMQANLEATRGLLFADAAVSLLAPQLGRGEAHSLVERASGEVRDRGVDLATALGRETSVDLSSAFDIGPSIRAASPWIDRVLSDAARVRSLFNP